MACLHDNISAGSVNKRLLTFQISFGEQDLIGAQEN